MLFQTSILPRHSMLMPFFGAQRLLCQRVPGSLTSNFNEGVTLGCTTKLGPCAWRTTGPVFDVLDPSFFSWACSWANTELTPSKASLIIFYLPFSEFAHDFEVHKCMTAWVVLKLVNIWCCKRTVIVCMNNISKCMCFRRIWIILITSSLSLC